MSQFSIINMKTESLTNPIGLDVEIPRFSWNMKASYRGARQNAYEIKVIEADTNLLFWNSGKVYDRTSIHIHYEGIPLVPCTRYQWTVTVWNEKDTCVEASATFETGLMDSSITAWEGADFIGPRNCSFDASSLSIYRITSTFRIPDGNTTAGIVFGAHDLRLSDRSKNTYGLEGENYICYMIDIAAIPATLHIYRVGYHPDDTADVPFFSVPIKDFDNPENLIITESNKHLEHSLELICEANQIKALLDGFTIDQIKDNTALAQVMKLDRYRGRQINPLDINDCPTYPRVCHVGFAAENGTAEFKSLNIYNLRTPGALLQSITQKNAASLLTDGLQPVILKNGWIILSAGTKRTIIAGDPSCGSAPMLRRTFYTLPGKSLKSARLYATARGIYEGYVNGAPVTDSLLNPGASQYDKHLYYQTYDITAQIKKGANAVGFYLASGWWCDAQTFTLMNYNYFGDRPALLSKVVLTYEDASRQVIISEPENWHCSTDGPVRYASFFHGEHYDATRETDYLRFCEADYDAGKWEHPILVETDKFEEEVGPFQMWPAPKRGLPRLIGRPGKDVVYGESKKALSVSEPAPGVYIYDMGQNMAGVPKLRLNGYPGQKIIIRYGEILYPALPEYDGLAGILLSENLRDATNTDIYICRGDGEEIYIPRFTFHGYRYIEITGLSAPLPLADIESISISSITEFTGHVETSDALVNKLFENITWSQRSNFISIPTDCPQRNERMGWMGDAQVFARTAAYNADVLSFFHRYLTAARDLQKENGKYPDIAPVGGGFGGIVWESAGIIIPWEMYQQYGDTRIVEENYPAMKKYIDYLDNIYENSKYHDMYFLGDWLATDMSTDENLIWLCHYAYDVKLLSRMAAVTGQQQDASCYESKYTELKDVFNKTFFDAATGKTLTETGEPNDTQCSYALPLAFGLFHDSNQSLAAKRLHEKTIELGHTLTTGFVGTGAIAPALADNGYAETAYNLLRQTAYPSWLYSITQGATTIWERWNSFTIENGFGGNNSMNSFNHYSLGAVGAWMYSHILGINRMEEYPGFAKFILKPHMENLTSAKGYYDSPYGRIESSWVRKANQIYLKVIIPANAEALLMLPDREDQWLTSGCYEFNVIA